MTRNRRISNLRTWLRFYTVPSALVRGMLVVDRFVCTTISM